MTEIEHALDSSCLLVCAAFSTLFSIIGLGKPCHDDSHAFRSVAEPVTPA